MPQTAAPQLPQPSFVTAAAPPSIVAATEMASPSSPDPAVSSGLAAPTSSHDSPTAVNSSPAANVFGRPPAATPLVSVSSQQLFVPDTAPPPVNSHSMTTRAKNAIHKPLQKMNLITQLQSSSDSEPTTGSPGEPSDATA
ncbi:hypothetical protein LWI29_012024 [Acer saccharum]|uniref:Uncharacterized protein n=1 Tax=Acer saccharum TaxID=4024 RepID=A0AA39VL02_ACESA|nr:hypothetical protein LWI29_012024 [Acer saccharum]